MGKQMANPKATQQREVRAAGWLYLATFMLSIPAAFGLYKPLAHDPAAFVAGGGLVTPVLWGVCFEVLNAMACVGTAVALYPVLRHRGPIGSIGFVASRTVEASTILVGAMAVLAIVALRDGQPAGDLDGLGVAARALMGLKDGSFLLGPGLMPVVNALCLAPILLRARLVPRAIPLLGLAGAPLLAASSAATLFGLHAQDSWTAGILVIPVFFWELSLGLWMALRGFAEGPA